MNRCFLSQASGAAAILMAAHMSTTAAAQEVPPPVGPQAEVPSVSAASEQPGGPPDNVYDDTWISIGVGAGLGASYSGSDDYVVFPAPLIQGKIGGVRISPRPAGLALDLIDSSDSDGPNFDLGPSFRLRSDRADQIADEVVELAGELDRAFEVGVTAGVGLPKLLNPFDSLTLSVDTRWDVAGAHSGMVVEPSVTYFTPLSRGIAASLSVSAQYADDSFNDYYYTVDAVQSAATGLAPYQADGGFNSLGTNLLLAVDFDGNLQNGGFSAVVIGGYSRLIGDAKDTPYTSVRGSADQFLGALGIGYTF